MKRSLFLLCSVSIAFLLIADCPAQTSQQQNISSKEEIILENLKAGIDCGNRGCCANCVYLLGELRCKGALIPLLKVLHNGECEEVRILAALSLYKINDARGIFAIKRAAIYDESERVKRICSIFYNAHLNREKTDEQKIENIARNK